MSLFPLWQVQETVSSLGLGTTIHAVEKPPFPSSLSLREWGGPARQGGWQESKKSGRMPPCCLETYTQLLSWQVEAEGLHGGLGDGLGGPAVQGQAGVHPRGPLALRGDVEKQGDDPDSKRGGAGVAASCPFPSQPVPLHPAAVLLPRALSLGCGALV